MTFSDFVFYVHIGSLFLAGAGILYADKLALSWLRGIRQTIPTLQFERAHAIVSIALGMIIGSGLFLFWPSRSFLLGETIFYVKMAFVLTLVLNSFAVGSLMHIAARKPFYALTFREKAPLFISGALSVLCWLGAGTAAFFLY